ncbi:MAG: NAD(P)/FAD-dependent oxidoreductase [Candidatus Thermoplasmatota archaeon]|nr:NAD(P)/FAD-dependent oxidoreductase [Candidatus Thermoplasmatota archaeon]MBS3790901.1 NAD(P)/FAD-dependent oxidoreductase [Candidatus Thermoplasmatota archaeon]
MDPDEGDILECDLLVVGGGPIGSTAARFAAKNYSGKIMVIEKRQEIGSPVRCAEGISTGWLDELEIEKTEHFMSKKVLGAKLYSPGGHELKIGKELAGDEVGAVMERDIFDKEMAVLAGREGVDYMLKTSAINVIEEEGRVKGVKARKMGDEFTIEADLVIGADGFESQIGRWADIYDSLAPKDIMTCFQYRMTDIDFDPDHTHFFLGSAAPGGYLWIFPKGEKTANVGMGVQLSQLDGSMSVRDYLDRFIEENEWLNQGQAIDMVAGGVSVSPPPEKVVKDGLMLVGDAARVVDPITGGGIANGMKQAKIAGEVAARALNENDTSEEFLQKYEERWREKLEDKLWRNYMAKEKAVQLDDEQFDQVIDALSDQKIEEMSTEAILLAVGEKYPGLIESFQDMM